MNDKKYIVYYISDNTGKIFEIRTKSIFILMLNFILLICLGIVTKKFEANINFLGWLRIYSLILKMIY